MDDEIKKLIAGFRRFHSEHFETEDGLYQRLTREGQSPRTMVIACCDSRVDPAIITDCDPGDLFVVRNVANLVPPYETGGHYHGTSAALEFAVRVIGVRHVIVLGHARCGGIRSLINGLPGSGDIGQFIRPWMAIAEEARSIHDRGGPERPGAAEQAAIRVSLRNLLSFPWIRDAVDRRLLALHGWYFDMDEGDLLCYRETDQQFVPLR